MRNRIATRCAAVLAVAFAVPAMAGSAVLETGQGRDRQQTRVEYRGDKLRLQSQGTDTGTMIVRDGQVYVIANDSVFEFSGMAGMLGSQMPSMSPGPGDLSRFIDLDATGRSETIAGASGTVHVLRYADENGREQREELVLSRDGRARELTDAMTVMSAAMLRAMQRSDGAGDAELKARLKGQGVLRYGKDFRVVSFGSDDPVASRFELPSAPQKLPSMGSLGSLGGGAAQTEGSQNDGGVLGKLFGNQAQRQQQRIEQRSEAEVDQATDEAVDGVLNKTFDRLFNR